MSDAIRRLRELWGNLFGYIDAQKDNTTSTAGEGLTDPAQGAAIITPENRGPYLLGKDKKLYAALASNGYIRQGTPSICSNDAIPVAAGLILPALTTGAYWRLISIQNTTAGAITVTVGSSAAAGRIYGPSSIAANTTVLLNGIETVGPVYADGGGSAGTQLCYVQVAVL